MSKPLLIVLVVVCAIILYLWMSGSNTEECFTPNTGSNTRSNTNSAQSYQYPSQMTINTANTLIDDQTTIDTVPQQPMENNDQYVQDDDQAASNNETARLQSKMITRDTADGSYKRINYKNGVRGDREIGDELNSYLKSSNELIQDDYMENDKYNGYDESQGKYASYQQEGQKSNKYSLSEIYNSDNYLPQNKRDDWFEVLPEAISVKNRHLINVSKPIGINTIGTSLRNPSWDIRGTPSCPKFVVAPWLQSTIEPDTNLKSLC